MRSITHVTTHHLADDVVYIGDCVNIDEVGNFLFTQRGRIESFEDLVRVRSVWQAERRYISQQEVLFPLPLALRVGGLNEDNHYSMDYELWGKFFLAGATVRYTGIPFGIFRRHEAQKTQAICEQTVSTLDAAEALLGMASDLDLQTKQEILADLQPISGGIPAIRVERHRTVGPTRSAALDSHWNPSFEAVRHDRQWLGSVHQMMGRNAATDQRRLNVLLVLPWDAERGGVVSVVDNLAQRLQADGHNVLFFHPFAFSLPEASDHAARIRGRPTEAHRAIRGRTQRCAAHNRVPISVRVEPPAVDLVLTFASYSHCQPALRRSTTSSTSRSADACSRFDWSRRCTVVMRSIGNSRRRSIRAPSDSL